MSQWNPRLSNLRNVLAGLYWEEKDARRLVMQVGMNPIFVDFSAKSVNTWQSILERAQHQNKLEEIIAQALEENPGMLQLVQAQQDQLHLAIETPPISDTAWSGPTSSDQLEKILGAVSTLRDIAFLQRGIEVSSSVGRITLADGSKGTGFLTNNNLLITNHHVVPSEAVASTAHVEFNVQKTLQGLNAKIDTYELDPTAGFVTSPKEEEGGNDWTAVRVRGNPNQTWGIIPLTQATPKLNDEVIIIQHPGGGSKQIAMSHNIVVHVDQNRLQYLTDTLEGSSGSPVFDINWRVVALHHKGGWLREPNSKMAVFRNQGVHINLVIAGLRQANLL